MAAAKVTASRRRRARYSRYQYRPTWMTAKRTAGLIVVAVALVLGVFGARTIVGLASVFHTNPISALVQIAEGGNGSDIYKHQVQNLQRINIAMYGYGGPGHDGPYLTDSIMVVSIQPRQGQPPQIAEISAPRDWYVPILDASGKRIDRGRINQAYSDGMSGDGTLPYTDPSAGGAVSDATLSHLLGLQINYFVGVDFTAFKDAVDSVGGVDVNVPNGFTDYSYPAGECYDGYDCGYKTVSFKEGTQHMNGATALEYARSRHGNNGEGSDFARSRRQQLILNAIKSKVLSIGGIGQLPDLLSALGDHVKTNLSINDAQAIYDLVKNVDPKTITHVSLDDTNFLYECGYPTNCGAFWIYAHDDTFKTISHFMNSVFVNPSITGANVPITIEDGSGFRNGAATRWTNIFGQLGFNLNDNGPTKKTAVTEVIDSTAGSGSQVANWFATFFGVRVTHDPPSSASPAPAGSTPGVTIILGVDEEKSFNSNPGVGN